MSETMYGSVYEEITSLFVDTMVFLFKSIFFLLESFYLTILPNRYRKLKDVTGHVVLITGGGGGVGANLAKNFAKLNARVVIWDINKDAIKTTVDLLARHNLECKSYVVDISNREQVNETARRVKDEIGNVDILINNAGIVACKPLWELPEKAIENTYSVNILSHYWTVKAFLPEMMEINRGHIVTVGSVAGLLGTYGCTDYSGTKFACVGLHESLYSELKTHGYDNIHLTLVCPYYINTGMFSGVKPRLMPMLEPDYVADQIALSVQKNEVNCTLPASTRMLLPLKCLLPAKMCWELMSRVMKGPTSMRMFKGRGRVAAG
ncbi:short-chain dehydrogenase/reductase family 16C member 6 [Bradysia coprophila]|uniref:short-chain dehydrogenase/reductase family 16C member 6 n=1 Tax=Bradysia coprophila TaxID=38358 RepID=UPI00187DB9F3|nr:short-chain dehydrogenase/reductase family 16C member 6 [Bradysia coprophila]